MRVLIIVTNADLSGAPVHVRDLALGLKSRGYDLHVVFGENGPIRDQLNINGIATTCVPSLRSNINPFEDLYSFKLISAVIRRFKPAILHLHSSKAGFVGRIVAFRFSLPSVYTVHGWGFGPGRRLHVSIFVRICELICRPITKRYITVSEADRLIGICNLHINPQFIHTIYNGSAFVASPNTCMPSRLVVVMVARNEHPKDYACFLKALIKAEFDQALLVGKGTDSDVFVDFAKKILGPKKAEKIKFLGAISNVEEILPQANVMVLSSFFEGLPISLIEGMSKGLVLLASRVGGVPELVRDGVNGWMFQAGDEDELAYYLNKLYENPELLRIMGRASLLHFISNFSLCDFVDNTINQYHLALS